jgi:hypothetical protein
VPPAFPGQARALVDASRDLGLEGVVLKRLSSTYQPGLSGDWLKIRHLAAADVLTTYGLAHGGPAAWEGRADSYRDEILGRLGEFTDGVPIAPGRHPGCRQPARSRARQSEFPAGDFNSVGLFVHQMLNYRPTPSLSDYAVPGLAALYLAGPLMHRGRGVWGRPRNGGQDAD